MKYPQLLIFDCDGVLVDSESLSSQVIAEEITKLGIPMLTEESQNMFKGGALSSVIEYVEKKLGKPIPYDFETVFRKRSFELFESSLEPIPGIVKALEELPHSKCVASNGPLKKMKFNLKLTKLMPYFDDNLFSAYDVNRWKPDPLLFLHAAKKMEVTAERCLVIEDSIHGVEAAVKAGMKVLGFALHSEGSELSAAGATVFKDMNELPKLIHSMAD
ncbi:MAG: HAD family hydrolase [Saprospiraceae bacterium]